MKKRSRKSNFELLRIICMIMIVSLHTTGHGGAFKNTNGINFLISQLIQCLSIVAVNCYVLISGYFGVNSDFKWKKVFNLYAEMLFYSIIISLLFWMIGIENISLESILSTFFPIAMQTWWFMSIFLILYILTPYINKLLISLSFKEFNNFLIILLFVFIVWPSLSIFKPIDNSAGFSLYQFIFIYIVGAYINIFYKEKKFNKNISIFIYILSSSVLFILNIFASKFKGQNWGMLSYNFILIFIASVALFIFFKEIEIQSNNINKLASLSLGVYLIHDHGYIRAHIYKLLEYNKYFNASPTIFLLYTLVIICIIYIGASIIEYLRQSLFKNIHSLVNKLKNI